MNRRHEDEREDRESRQYGRPRRGYQDEQSPGGPGYGGGWSWSDQVWSGAGRFDDAGIAPGPYGYRSREYRRGAYDRGPYGPSGPGGPSRYETRVPGRVEPGSREGWYGRPPYGEDQYGWIEYDEPRYVGSLYRGERRGEESYREHEWQQSREPPGLLTRVFARGPKGYTRSDERITEDISERLWRAEFIDSSDVTVEVREGVAVLSGTVPERWMRHEIENIADSCMGVQDIENNIRVQRRTIEETEIEPSGTRAPLMGAGGGTATGTKSGSSSGTSGS